ncbi:MAG: hypothetical protein PHH31_08545 [Acidaminococcaceae bacterium]|nr:hypothetical protein [Acidaminococcaceae bacterium]MDD4722102.1 hypothetical protein [Acidaminococcaceae bacterium]
MRMKWQHGFLGFIFILMFLPTVALAAPIEHVQVNIQDSAHCAGKILLNRMTSSIQVVAEQLLLEREIKQISASQADYADLLQEVADRVLTGYQVEKVDLIIGPTTKVSILLSPWGKVIENVQVDIRFSDVDDHMAAELLKKMPQLQTKIKGAVLGASVDATDWAGGILRQMIRAEVVEALPNFKAAVDLIRQGDNAVVQVVVYPVGKLVQNVHWEIMSDNMPNILFLETNKVFTQEVNNLRGLPVQYISDNIADVQRRLLDVLKEQKAIRLYGIDPTLTIIPGTDTLVKARLDSPRYKVWFEGYSDIGRDGQNISGVAHIGKYMSGVDEIFAEASVTFNPMEWEVAPGYMRKIGHLSLGYARRISDEENNYRLEYKFSSRWKIRAEHFSGSANNEFGLRYRIHEFLSAEYVYAKDKAYLRLVGNL